MSRLEIMLDMLNSVVVMRKLVDDVDYDLLLIHKNGYSSIYIGLGSSKITRIDLYIDKVDFYVDNTFLNYSFGYPLDDQHYRKILLVKNFYDALYIANQCIWGYLNREKAFEDYRMECVRDVGRYRFSYGHSKAYYREAFSKL